MCAVTDLDDRKATVRRLVMARRARLTADERAAAGAAVAARVAALPELAGARRIVGFASFGLEIPTDETLAWVLGSRRELLLPYVDGPNLRAARIGSMDDLAPGYRGIREPVERVIVAVEPEDVILVPGVAFDAEGRRLGYGGGFYDAFLAESPDAATRVGLCYDVQVWDEVPEGDGDERVDVVVTGGREFRPGKSRKVDSLG